MKKEQLNHLIRAAKDISSKLNFLIIGSQAVIGDAEIYAELEKRASLCLQSPEIDVMTFDVVDNDIQVDEDSTELLEWGLGETSRFFDTFGYYLQDKALYPRPLGRGYKALNVLLTITQSRLNLLKLFFQVFLCQQDVNPKVLPIRVNPKWRTSTQTETVLRLLPFCV